MPLKKKIIPHLPQEIGSYKILKSLGRGGMGEVLLSYDPMCDRKVALKRVRPDMQHLKGIQQRFLKEAKIASQLSHPSIISIYSIYEGEKLSYYTMTYVEGKTLKEILQEAKLEEEKGEKARGIGGSIPELCRIFLNICEAIAFTHEKGYLHRDLKPENFIIGKYGEVTILDWGIAEKIKVCEQQAVFSEKIAGTLSYLAPERILKQPSSIFSDIYSLGAILYQILTLQIPFERTSLSHFREIVDKEALIDPIEVAPYRDIPHALSEIVKKCLAFDQTKRYKSVNDLIFDLKKVIEGRPKWSYLTSISIYEKQDWEFQETVCLTKHLAMNRSYEFIKWVNFMVSKHGYHGNIKIHTDVLFKKKSSGIGILFSIPEAHKRSSLEEGYHLWISPQSCKLYRNGILVLETAEIDPAPLDQFLPIEIKKTDHQVCFYFNHQLIINYFSHLPLAGTHLGLINRDTDFSIKDLKLYVGSHTVFVNCLCIPDAFLIHKQFDIALNEYRRIANSFPGRAEGREALFRIGLTLLEQSKTVSSLEQQNCYNQALEEFSSLRATPGAPLEYLGKSLVYAALKDAEEEAKCLELAYRKYPKHPLISRIQEHILYRIHESSINDKEASFRLLLLALRFFPTLLKDSETTRFLSSLKHNLEPLYFFQKTDHIEKDLAIQLAFWIGKKQILIELLDQFNDEASTMNLLFCLLELGFIKEVKKILKLELFPTVKQIFVILTDSKLSLDEQYEKLSPIDHIQITYYLLHKAIDTKQFSLFRTVQNSPDDLYLFHLFIWANLLQNRIDPNATKETIQNKFPFLTLCFFKKRQDDFSFHHFLDKQDLYSQTSATLLQSYLLKHIHKNLMPFEKKQLHRQLHLYYECSYDEKRAKQYLKKLK